MEEIISWVVTVTSWASLFLALRLSNLPSGDKKKRFAGTIFTYVSFTYLILSLFLRLKNHELFFGIAGIVLFCVVMYFNCRSATKKCNTVVRQNFGVDTKTKLRTVAKKTYEQNVKYK